MVRTSWSTIGVVHAWVARIVLEVCNESKTKSVRPTEARVGYDNHGWRGHGCTWLAVLKHGGILGACFKTLLQLRACTPRPAKLPRTV